MTTKLHTYENLVNVLFTRFLSFNIKIEADELML